MEFTLKLDENGKIVVDETGNPIGIFKDGEDTKEEGIDIQAMFSKIAGLNKESAERRHKLNDVTKLVKILEDGGVDLEKLEDFVNSSKANSQKIADFSEKDMKSAEEIERIKKGVSESYEEKIKELNGVVDSIKDSSVKDLATKEQVIRNLLIKGAFDKSSFIKDKTVLTSDIAFNTFGRSFKVEEDGVNIPKVYAVDHLDEKIFSKTKPGEYADPEEAIEILIKAYPQSDSVLRTSQGGDGGKPHVSQQNGRFDIEKFSNLSPTEKLKVAHGLKK